MSKQAKYELIKHGISDTSEAPRGKGVLYRCTECGGLVPSAPKQNVGCLCGNIFIDTDYFRLAVRNYSKFEAVKRMK